MSAAICWERVKEDHESLYVLAPSSFIESMERAGLRLPCEIGDGAVPVLTGMAAMHRNDGKNPYEEMIELIEKHGTIRIWAEY